MQKTIDEVKAAIDAKENVCTVWMADLRNANLRGANLRVADLSDADLRGADLSGADLSDADLRNANLRGADLSVADLRGANLRVADLSGANLRDANLRDADLSDADLRGANLRNADLRGAKIPVGFCKWSVSYNDDGTIFIGCQKNTIAGWDAWFAGNAEFSTPRNDPEFRRIYAAYCAARAEWMALYGEEKK